ncbi:hypothetical protein IWW37_003189 [Coemansia sp. RSA 2050]|nr:hypothetical protein IWW37_003189 [Coemansia sp. RSA 2050]KAJ2733149.1 hypothetical protein IW152_003306 [Coemansia sp. BCRC 34962]
MYSIAPALALLALLSAPAQAEDLITDASTITNTQSYISAVSQSWASVYYRVNQNLNDALYAGKSQDYATATWLYGTTQLPAAYVATWAPGYLSRAKELNTRTTGTASQTKPSAASESSDESEASETSETSDTKGNSAAASARAMGSALLIAAALSVAASMV